MNDEVVLVQLVQLVLVLGLEGCENNEGLLRKPGIGPLTGVWEARAPGCCTASVDELGVLCNKAFNESLIVGVSVYHIERDEPGVGIPAPYNLEGGWRQVDTVVTNEVSLAFLRNSLDHSADERSENWDTTSSS